MVTSTAVETSTREAHLPFSEKALSEIAAHLNPLLADVFALYLLEIVNFGSGRNLGEASLV